VFPEVMAEFKLTNRQIIVDRELFREVVLSNAACAISKFIIAKAKKL